MTNEESFYGSYDVIAGGNSLQAANMAEKSGGKNRSGKEMRSHDDSSDSENEAEPAKSFHRRMSTNREIKTTVSDSRLCFPRDSKSRADWYMISTVGRRDFPIFKVVPCFTSVFEISFKTDNLCGYQN